MDKTKIFIKKEKQKKTDNKNSPVVLLSKALNLYK